MDSLQTLQQQQLKDSNLILEALKSQQSDTLKVLKISGIETPVQAKKQHGKGK